MVTAKVYSKRLEPVKWRILETHPAFNTIDDNDQPSQMQNQGLEGLKLRPSPYLLLKVGHWLL